MCEEMAKFGYFSEKCRKMEDFLPLTFSRSWIYSHPSSLFPRVHEYLFCSIHRFLRIRYRQLWRHGFCCKSGRDPACKIPEHHFPFLLGQRIFIPGIFSRTDACVDRVLFSGGSDAGRCTYSIVAHLQFLWLQNPQKVPRTISFPKNHCCVLLFCPPPGSRIASWDEIYSRKRTWYDHTFRAITPIWRMRYHRKSSDRSGKNHICSKKPERWADIFSPTDRASWNQHRYLSTEMDLDFCLPRYIGRYT